jgi:hypothetical protein
MTVLKPRRFYAACCFLGAVCLTTSCSRKTSAPNDAGVDAGIDASVVAIPTASATTAPPTESQKRQADPADAAIPPAEPIRKVVSSIDGDAALAHQRDAIIGFFKDDLPSPIAAQFEVLPGNRSAILIPGKKEVDRPFVMVIDSNGTRAWTKTMPLAGIVSGVRDIAIVRGMESSVGIAFCDSTGKTAALRMWHDDGSINADFEVMEVPHCDKISAVYIPGVGHIVASSGETTARIGMIADNGMRVWDSAGIALPWIAMANTALTIAVDSEKSFVVVGINITEEKRRPNDGAISAMRYDMQGREVWSAPITVGHRSGRSLERIAVRVVGPEKLEVDIADKPTQRVTLSSTGVVVPQ